MGSNVNIRSRIHDLEFAIQNETDLHEKMRLINELAAKLTFSDINKTKQLLVNISQKLDLIDDTEILLQYYLNTAIVQNLLYKYESAEAHFKKALNILIEFGSADQQIEAYIDYSGTLINLNKLDQADNLLNQANKLLEAYQNEPLKARYYCRAGMIDFQYNNMESAVSNLFEAEKLFNSIDEYKLEIKDYYFHTLVQSGLAIIYATNGDTIQSIRANRTILDICEKKGMKSRLSWYYLNVGKDYVTLNDFDHASYFLKKAIDTADDASTLSRAWAIANLGSCFSKQGKYQEALDHFQKAEHIISQTENVNLGNLCTIERWKAKAYKAIDKKKEAKNSLKIAQGYANRISDYKQLFIIYSDLAELAASNNNFEEAYKYQCFNSKTIEKYEAEKNARKLVELQVKYESEKKKREAERLGMEAAKLQLTALQAQMNPHFLSNALNSIQTFVKSNDERDVSTVISSFANLMRQSLTFSNCDSIILQDEINFLENYLLINQKLRYQNLNYEITLEDDLEDEFIHVPPMIIQPFIENAIEHGVKQKENGMIKVHFSEFDEHTIHCVIEDNGIGREKARQAQEANEYHRKHQSLGTDIIQKRLELLNKSHLSRKFSFTYKDLKDYATKKALGTRVELLIPIINDEIVV